MRLDQRRDGLLAQFLERLGVPEERGDVDEQVLVQLVDLVGVPAKQLAVLGHVRDAVQPHPALDAPQDGALLVAAEIAARLGQHEARISLKPPGLLFGLQDGRRLAAPDVGLPEIFHDGLGHLVGRKDAVHQSGGDGAARHVAELGGLGSCAMVSPPAPRIARTPSVPSEPAPENRTQTARSCRSSARERKKKSMGIRMPCCVTGSARYRTPSRMPRY